MQPVQEDRSITLSVLIKMPERGMSLQPHAEIAKFIEASVEVDNA